MTQDLFVVWIGLAALSASYAVWRMTRGMFHSAAFADGVRQVRAAARSRQWRWPSDMHADGMDKARMKDAGVLGVAIFQRLLKDDQGPAPLTAVALIAHTISSILLFVAAQAYWSTPVAWLVVMLYLGCFWPYQVALLGGFQGLAQMFLLGAVVCFQQAEHAASLVLVVWYLAAGILIGCMMFASASGRKFLPMAIGALWFSQREALSPLGIAADGWVSLTHGFGLALITLVGTLTVVLAWVAARRTALADRLVRAIYLQKAPGWANRLIQAKDRMPLESYLSKGRLVTHITVGLGVAMVGYLALWVALSRAPSVYVAHALVVLGFCAAVLFFTYPNVIWNLKGYLGYWHAAAHYSHYPLFAQMLAQRGAQVRPNMRAPDVPWLIRFFWRQVPFHCLLLVWSLLAIGAGLILQGWDARGLAAVCGMTLLSASPLIYGGLTKSPLCSRPYYPGFLGLLLFIGYGACYAGQIFPGSAQTGWWAAAIGIAGVGAVWNLWMFVADLWPARMAGRWLADTLEAKGIRHFATYETPYNRAFIDVFPPDVRRQFTIRYVKALREAEDGYVVVPETSSKSFQMSSHDYAATRGDFNEDPELTALIESRQITRYALASFKMFGASRFWGHEHDVISYREFFLHDVTERDRWRGRGWLLDAKQLAQARGLRESAQGSPAAIGG